MFLKRVFIYLFVFCLLFGYSAQAQLVMPSTTNEGIEAQVSSFFSDAPEMVGIAKCESAFRQFSNNMPLLGGAAHNYVGVYQISSGHAEEALAMGMDIYTTQGNLAYAKYLYQKQGTIPWKGCVTQPTLIFTGQSPAVTSQPPVQASSPAIISLTLNLKIGMTSPEVVTLQQLLNSLGYKIAASGPGSAGNETNLFGQLTKAALQRFQCEKNIVCEGVEATTGYGRLGPQTRAVILAASSK